MNKKLRTTLKVFFRVIAVLVLLEGLLRAHGLFILKAQERENREKLEQGHKRTILCLGGSLTTLGGDDSYTSQLQRILNSSARDGQFTVINKGIPAADSSRIVDTAVKEKWFDKYKPDIVVAMMGLNDRRYKLSVEDLPAWKRISDFLEKHVNVYRMIKQNLFKQSAVSLNGRGDREGPDEKNKDDVRLEDYYGGIIRTIKIPEGKALLLYKAGTELFRKKQYAEAVKVYQAIMNADVDMTHKETVARQLAEALYPLGRYPELMGLFEYMLVKNDNDMLAVDRIIWMGDDAAARKYAVDLLLRLLKKKSGSVTFNTLLGLMYLKEGDKQKSDYYYNTAAGLREKTFNPETKRNFAILTEQLYSRGIKGVYVQYPLRSAAPMREMLKGVQGFEGLAFVDNNASFREAVEKDGYDAYFVDRASGDFGHCTPSGYRLLAENIARAILNY